MTEKRFIEFSTQNTDDGELNNGFNDIKTGEWYYTKDSENSKSICELLNTLHEENEQLKEENKDSHKKEVELGQNYLRLLEENLNLKKQLDYIQNLINKHIKHQKTELGQKALRKIIEDYNEWMLGHEELKE